jgi:hypothetical protein
LIQVVFFYCLKYLFCSFIPGSTPGTTTKLHQAPIEKDKDMNIEFISSIGSALMCIAYIPWGIEEIKK